jgi:hypothetical protein
MYRRKRSTDVSLSVYTRSQSEESTDLRLIKAQTALPQRHIVARQDDQTVEQFYIKYRACLPQFLCDKHILGAGRAVPCGVLVGDQDGYAVQPDWLPIDLGGSYHRAVDVSLIHGMDFLNSIRIVETGHTQLLLTLVTHAHLKKRGNVAR